MKCYGEKEKDFKQKNPLHNRIIDKPPWTKKKEEKR